MKKLLVLVVLSCLLAVWGATAAVLSPPDSSVPLYKTAEAAVDPLPLINNGKYYLQTHDILAAREQFAKAVAAAPDNQEANLLLGVTRVFAILEQPGSSAGMDSVREIFEFSGFSFETFGLYGIEGTDPEELAPTTPRTGAVLDFVGAKVLPELEAALANLAKVTSPSFSSIIAPSAIAATYGGNLAIDYADALVIKALLNVVICNLNLMIVYGPDVSIPEIGVAPDQLMTYKQLFADASFLTPHEPARLTTARTALVNFIDTYTMALPVLQARAGSAHHLFVVDAPVSNEPFDLSAEGLQEIAGMLAEVRAAVDGAHVFPGSGPEQNRKIDLSKLFDAASPISIRSSLSNCASGLALPDPTFKGLFPDGITGQQDFLARYGSHILGVTCSGRETPLLEVDPSYISIWDSTGFPAEPETVTLANRGTATLHVSSLSFTGTNAADFTVTRGSCTSLTPTLAVGTSCTVSVATKRPPTTFGYLNAELQVASDDLSNLSSTVSIWGYQQPPPAGVVRGKVKDAATQQGMQAYVTFYDSVTGSWGGQTYSDSTGAYSISGMNSGSYKVSFSALDSRFINQWYRNKPDQQSADTVVLTPADLNLADAALIKGGAITGWVRDAAGNQGLSYVTVTVYDSQTNKSVASATSNWNGSYTVQRLPSGSYKVKVGNSGGYYAPQWYNAGAPVTVTAPDNTTLNEVLLSQGGGISGRVRDAASSAGISGVSVGIYSSQSGEFLASSMTDYSGYYNVTGLPSGGCKVMFTGQQINYQNLWYVNAASMSTATAVTVTAPVIRTGIDAALRKVASTGTTLASSPNPSLTGQSVSFTATVSAATGTPGGHVTFKDGSQVLGGATLNASGQASLTTSSLAAGSHSITASYDGNNSFNVSSSQTLTQVVNQQVWTLSVVTAGAGSGSVHSNPTGIACVTGSSAECSASFNGGSSVTLTPSVSSNSLFGGWTGACTGTGSCQVLMNAARSVTASFSAKPATVRIDGRTAPYHSIGGALDAISTQGQTVRAKAESFVENVIMTSPAAIRLKGGFTDAAFLTRTPTSFTVLDGYLKIRQGTLRIERLLLR
ncbi:MAG: hypothetical protein A2075_02675 [Geobacteraceae bacterium GWC2_58_44]|nr:MAG: hypothetical protein A2075_02675 [Geobacteraceae bacterium GWC2_58_44]HBG05179.1 hypothetical protein [Geobacter sp.]